jgi:hypothetical protein
MYKTFIYDMYYDLIMKETVTVHAYIICIYMCMYKTFIYDMYYDLIMKETVPDSLVRGNGNLLDAIFHSS